MLIFPSSYAWLFLRAVGGRTAAVAAAVVFGCYSSPPPPTPSTHPHTLRVDRLMHMDLCIYHILFSLLYVLDVKVQRGGWP